VHKGHVSLCPRGYEAAMGTVRIGTCSWADRTMVEAWYPPEAASAEARLRYYAARFDTVEADSPFYGIPTAAVTRNWARRTPAGFTFHVKAYGLMTGHSVDERSLPPEVRTGFRFSLSPRGRVHDPEDPMLDRVFRAFRTAVEPLRGAAKLGGVLMQYPPSFRCLDEASLAAGLRRMATDRERLEGLTMMVEFRHASWLDEANRARVLRFMAEEGLVFVSVDAPRMPAHDATALPPVSAVTAPIAYVRFHGRNRETWHLKGASASDRFDYLYDSEELREWEKPIRDLVSDTDTVFAMFNNCRRDYAPRNARDLADILGPAALRPDGSAPGTAPAQAAEQSGELRLDI
jgi:uncharacterized protein YecE (DUF72 family)